MKRAGRQAKWITLTRHEKYELRRLIGIADERSVCRAMALLAMADTGTCVKALADQVGLTRSAVWRLCRRFEEHGVGSARGLYPCQK